MDFPGHGTDLTLAAALGPLMRGSDLRLGAALDRLKGVDLHAASLDATLAGMRPRELSTRDRRDLAAAFSRADVRIAGVDLFIPRRHLLDPAHEDRAIAAVLGAFTLAADLGRVPISLAVPFDSPQPKAKSDARPGDADHDQTEAEPDRPTALSALLHLLAAEADRLDTPLAVHAEDHLDALAGWLDEVDHPMVGAGLDPAALISVNRDPATAAARLAHRLTGARLSDATGSAGDASAHRCPPGDGMLDLTAYRLACDLTSNRPGPVVLDLRHVAQPWDAIVPSGDAWEKAAPQL